ncbi:MAG: FtsQ-type POTRA domain-containing protein [Clostridiales bacterium]|nr:FtsQ-type POTRA domain-containing protein [Clostridiales bacterium]
MKKKSILAITVSVLLILVAIAAGLSAVYTVSSVKTQFSVYSEAGREECKTLQATLDGYAGKSILFLDLEDIRGEVDKYPCLKVEEVKKSYPKTVELTVTERIERYAIERTGEDGKVFYSVLDENGIYLYDKEQNVNRLDGAPNILIEGLPAVSLAVGQVATGAYTEELFTTIAAFREDDENVRLNLVSVAFEKGASDEATTRFTLMMQEGTRIEINNLTALVEEKAKVAFERYFTLEDEDKMFGVITVNDDRITGGFNVSYTIQRDL